MHLWHNGRKTNFDVMPVSPRKRQVSVKRQSVSPTQIELPPRANSPRIYSSVKKENRQYANTNGTLEKDSPTNGEGS